jgi:FkbM family methyltransferase
VSSLGILFLRAMLGTGSPAALPSIVERLLKRLRLHWIIDARTSTKLGYRRMDGFKLAVLHVVLALAEVAHLPRMRPLSVRLAPDGYEVVISDLGEIGVLQAIFLKSEYESTGDPAVIFDLGANVGFAALFFSRRHPAAQITAVEADPRTYRRLVRNVQQLPNVTSLHRAVAGEDGSLNFFSSSSSISSSTRRTGSDDQVVAVPGSRLETLMNEMGVDHIDLLKIDIEGAEFEVLANAPLERINEIVAEIHYDLADGDEQTLRDLLAGFELTFRPLPYPGRSLLLAQRLT